MTLPPVLKGDVVCIYQVTELEWPLEMLQETVTEPPIVWSCNPLAFDFSQLYKKPQVSRLHLDPVKSRHWFFQSWG